MYYYLKVHQSPCDRTGGNACPHPKHLPDRTLTPSLKPAAGSCRIAPDRTCTPGAGWRCASSRWRPATPIICCSWTARRWACWRPRPRARPCRQWPSRPAATRSGCRANIPHVALPLPFLYESTGVETYFRDGRDPRRVPGGSSASTGPRPWRSG